MVEYLIIITVNYAGYSGYPLWVVEGIDLHNFENIKVALFQVD